MLKVASFFAGIGGFDLGLEKAGMKIVFQCEINKFCQKVLKQHWPKVPLFEDIGKVNPSDIPSSAEVWCGGFPCQDLSLANQGKRKGLEGERSGLFYKYAELIASNKPRWVIIENVPGLLNSHQGKDFQVLLEKLDELGYGVSWRVFDAKYFGTPQRRRRVYVVASLGNLRSAQVLFESGPFAIASRSGIGKRETTFNSIRESDKEANIFAIQHASIGRKSEAGPQAKGYRNDGESYTLDSRGSADAVCKTVDAFRVRDTSGISQTLDGNRYRAVGNAVCVHIVHWIGQRIMAVENEWNKELKKTKKQSN
ncbi:DNA (cytosine-5-)-methyltransferase [Undibacterium jejuense]|uniref:DNA (cytosine-5-)-methyltransferase n=1 Tax=Undibacterium jejuense TaxID=1344949 RepID=A0A923HR85_9BURK|nr:DNA (cytosine-5-)-methyltransferase [Undibacterium jejuense]MBC3864246.1 DNA (cytosine-5-)-methyltransferase [Undibacterium jejuense]